MPTVQRKGIIWLWPAGPGPPKGWKDSTKRGNKNKILYSMNYTERTNTCYTVSGSQ